MTEHRQTARWLVVVALVVLPFLAAETAVAGNAGVRATFSNTWNPVRTRVDPGSQVTWRNPSMLSHTVTAFGGNWSINRTLMPGQFVRRTFRVAGVFRFRCVFHSSLVNGVCSGMCGRIVVHV